MQEMVLIHLYPEAQHITVRAELEETIQLMEHLMLVQVAHQDKVDFLILVVVVLILVLVQALVGQAL